MQIATFAVNSICLLVSSATTEDKTASAKTTEEESQFLLFDGKRPFSRQRDWLKLHETIFNRAENCDLRKSSIDLVVSGPDSFQSVSGPSIFASFLVLRDVDGYGSASRIFPDEESSLDVEAYFSFFKLIRNGRITCLALESSCFGTVEGSLSENGMSGLQSYLRFPSG